MPSKTRILCQCGGGPAQHNVDLAEEGCWCPKCLQRPEADRCRQWQPMEVAKTPPKVNRNVAPAGKRHPASALEAARKARPRAGTRRYEVFKLIEKAGTNGLTDDELESLTGRSHQAVSATRNTLMNDGLIEESGHKRRTQWGNLAIAWRKVQ